MAPDVAGVGKDSRNALALPAALSTITEDQESHLSRQSSVASENIVRAGSSSSVLTLSSTDFEDEDTCGEEGFEGFGNSTPAAKWGDRGEATLFKRTHHVKKLRQFMPSIIEETEELCREELEDEENEAAFKTAEDVDEHDTHFDAEFLKFIIETNVVAKDPSQADPDFAQDFGEVLRMLRKKAKLEEAFAKDIAGHMTAMRIKEKAILLKYIRHILLHDAATTEEFFRAGGFTSIVNVSLSNDETLDQLPGIMLATRGQQAVLRQLVDDGVISLLAKLSKRTEDAIMGGAAVAHACLVDVQAVDEQAKDAWFECLFELGSTKSPTAQTYACATLCKAMAQASRQAKLLQKTGTGPFFKLFTTQRTPEALLWVSSAIANVANNSANFQDFLEVEALDVLHSMSNSTWDEVRLAGAWILVFLSLHKALHQQAIGHWGTWVREALTIGLCSNDSLTTGAIRIFFANVTQKEPFKGYESPIVRSYLKMLHMSDDLVREHAQAFLFSTARQHPTELIESLLALCCAEEDAEHNAALKALSLLVIDKEFQVDVTKYNVLRPFVCAADCADASTQLLCAQVLTSFVSTSQSLQDHQDSEPVSALLFLCDSRHDDVRAAALNGLWAALEVGLRYPEMCALPILRCCKEDETAESLRACYCRLLTEARKEFTAEWIGRASRTTSFGVSSLCTLVHDASAPVQGRLAYEIEKFSEDQEGLSRLDEIGARMLVYALLSLGKSVVNAVKCSVVTAFTRLISCKRLMRNSCPAGPIVSKMSAASSPGLPPSDESLQSFLAENYTQCVCDTLLDPSAGAELQQHCLHTLYESLDDPLVCHCLGTSGFMPRLFALENTGPTIDPLTYYRVYCRILSSPAMVGHVSSYVGACQRLLLDAKDFPSLVLPLAQLLHTSSFLPSVQGFIYANLKEICKLLVESANDGATSEAVIHCLGALARLSRVPGSKFQQFDTPHCSLPRPMLLDLLALLQRYSIAPLSQRAETSEQVCIHIYQVPLRQSDTTADSTLVSANQLEAEKSLQKESIVSGDQVTRGEAHTGELLKGTVKALLALYRLGLIQDNLDCEIMKSHLLPLFQNMHHSNNSMVPLLSFANCLCEDPVFLGCLLSTSIVSDIASGLARDSLHDEELCVQVAEFLRVAVLHEGAQEEIIADIALVDCIFRLICSSHPAAQVRALSALHSIVTHASILRTLMAENFIQVLCDLAASGVTADVQRVAAGVISTIIARPSCREVLLTSTSLTDITNLVRAAGTPEVYLQIVWALSNLPLKDDIVQVLTDMRVPERFKEMLSDQPPRIQIQALNTLMRLSSDAKLRHRFIKLGFLPLLVNVAKSDDSACCAESLKALLSLSDSAAESATVLDLGLELTIQGVLQKCLQQNQDLAKSRTEHAQANPPAQQKRQNSDTTRNITHSARFPISDWDESRKASLALLCQLCTHAVHDQLALLNNETVRTVMRCTAHTLPCDTEERRYISKLFCLWAAIGRLRKLMVQERGLDLIIRLVIQAYDAAEMVALASCIGSFASEKNAALETRLAESGAIDALQMYTLSRHSSVRGSAQRALSNITQDTMEYSRLLATRESDTLGLSATDQESRDLLKRRWSKAGDARVPAR